MRLPVLYNSNFQVQDQDGVIIADLFRNPNAEEDGKAIVFLLNQCRELEGPPLGYGIGKLGVGT